MPGDRYRILVIGNSFTARNNLPGLLADLAAAHGITLAHRLLSIGGTSLRIHWNKGEALEASTAAIVISWCCRSKARCRSRTRLACAKMCSCLKSPFEQR